ncbi:MAG: efflux RND transporter periplasmic adaptor subunit [Symploca sp. SIO2G7]|nr:efflux RND transporter periplasmic adaptor subunit [Symploca sp. SIO2G7]
MTYQNFQDDPQVQESANGHYENDAALGSEPTRSVFLGMRGIGLGLLLGVGISFIGSKFISRPAAAPVTKAIETSAGATSVTVQPLQTATIQQSLEATGTVQAFDLLQISPQVGGLQIREVRVREGDQVAAGQVLAILDDSILQTQLTQANANYTQAEAQVLQAKAEQAQAEANAAEAKENFERYRGLFNQGGISAQELESRRTEAITAREAVGVAQAVVQSAQATVNSRAAEISRLETQLAQTVVAAPARGQIAERQATVGDTSASGTPLFTLVQDGVLELVVDLPQRQLASVQVGTPVTVTSSSDERIRLSGVVRSIDPLVNTQTRQAAVNVSLSTNEKLRTGMFLQAKFMTGQRTGRVLPAAAVLPQPDNSFRVFTISETGTAEPVLVTVGSRVPATANQPERLEILSGVTMGTQVIVEGASYLQPGDPVSAVSSPFSGEPSAADISKSNTPAD